MNPQYCNQRDHSWHRGIIGAVLLLAVALFSVASADAATHPRLVLTPAPGFNISWDGNNGGFQNPDVGAGPSNNVALASNGTIPIGSSQLDFGVHFIANINDGLYGNSGSWISDFTIPDPDPWIGLAFPVETLVESIAWGRDNGNTATDACGGTCTDRNIGIYRIQYTLVPSPDETITETGEPFTGWADLGTIEYLPGADDPDFVGYLRHRYDVDFSGNPIPMTGMRIKVSDPGIAIDEIEINPIPDPIPPIDLVLDINAESGFAIAWDGNEGNFSTEANPALVPKNAAQDGTAFGSSEFGAGVHLISNINDGQYGNAFSWIANFPGGDPDPFIGINLGEVIQIRNIAWSRDNGNVAGDCCGGTLVDRAIGVYTLQITMLTDANETTAETGDASTGWQTIGTVEYKGNDPTIPFNSYLRHRFEVSQGGTPILAAALRVKVSNNGMAIDEIEINANQAIEQMLLTTAAAPGFEISWDGNEGEFFSPNALAPAPVNRALVSEGTTPFSSSDLGPVIGIPFHVAANLNDGLYGNANSWISANGLGGTTDPDPFAGLSFGGSVLITNIAWGRDNGNLVETGCAGGTCVDRTPGTYQIQYTLVENPDALTPETGDPFTGWGDIGTVTIGPAVEPDFRPWLRHRFEVSMLGGPIEATGIRIRVPDGFTALDEIEINAPTGDGPPPDPFLVIEPADGIEIDWDGNEGIFSTDANPAPSPYNVAQGGTAFGSSEFGAGVHLISNVNDGQYGNSFSWLANFPAGDPDPFIGVNLGEVTDITSIAWSRDNGNVAGDCCGGTLTDRVLGTYTLQVTLLTDADASTPETGDSATGWRTIGTVEFRREDPILFTPHLRHRFDVSEAGEPIQAAAVRIKVSDQGMVIDELEINPNRVLEDNLLVVAAEPGFDISWDGNEGQFFSPTGEVPENRALATQGTIPFSSSDLGPILGIPFHVAQNLNDGLFGNANSWISANGIGGTSDPDPFAGLNFGGTVLIENIAWGRDNLGQFVDRGPGTYLLQYSLVPDPDASTVDTGDPFTGWANIGTVTYGASTAPFFSNALRHRFDLSFAGGPFEATGIRIKVPNGNTAIDEIEINTPVTPPPPTLPIVIESAHGFEIAYDRNNGDFFGETPPDNRGLAANGTVPFTSSDLGPLLNIPFHIAANLNDGIYGNGNSWISAGGIGGPPDPVTYAGLNFNGLIEITSIAWGRENLTGQFTDRAIDLYTVQITRVADPGQGTADTGDASTGWATVGTVNILGSLPELFDAHKRHEFGLAEDGAPVLATGLRIIVANPFTAIDEIEVQAIFNPPPVCDDITAETFEDAPVNITLSAVDPDGGPVFFVVLDGPANGIVSVSGDTATYTPNANFNGPDSFTYIARDMAGSLSSCTVDITVIPLNDEPSCSDGSAVADEDVPVQIDLPVGDVDGDVLTVTITGGPANGTVSVNGTVVTYTGNLNYNGTDAFSYFVEDGNGAFAGDCTIDITINPVNDAPNGVIEVSPLADLGDGVDGLVVLSADGEEACVTLDGSASSDVEGDPIVDYIWLVNGEIVGAGVVLETCLPVGINAVTLVTDDGQPENNIGETTVAVEVLTSAEAIETLVLTVEEASIVSRKNKQQFIATLKTAIAAFDRGSNGAAVNKLQAFINKVNAQLKDDPEVRDELIRIAELVIDLNTEE